MRPNILERLRQEILLFDGAMGTQLQMKGLPIGEFPERWNLQRPEMVQEVHREYVEAGAQILITNSFGGNRYKLEGAGLGGRVYEVNRRPATLAREVAGSELYVAGSVGPTGLFLEPVGELTTAELADMFREQMRGLIDGGVDLICIETMLDVAEAVVAIRVAKELTDIPVLASMTYQKGNIDYRTIMGTPIPEVVHRSVEAGADIIGTNCGEGIDAFIEIVTEMRRWSDRPICAAPNAGIPQWVTGKTVYPETPDYMADRLPHLIAAGANIVGGCCGTTPEHIRLFAKKVR